MKRIIKNIAMLAFFGCMALVGISAPGKNGETCTKEWSAGFTGDSSVADKKEAGFRGTEEQPASQKSNLFFAPAGIMNFIWQ